jgi:CHAT domain
MKSAIKMSAVNRRLTLALTMSPSSPSIQLHARLVSPGEQPLESTGISYLKVDSTQIAQVSSILSRLSLRFGAVQSGASSLDPVVDLGSQLCSLLFEGDLSRLYAEVLSAESAGISTPISIEPDADALASIPWELLFDRSKNSFVALSSRTPIVRLRTPMIAQSSFVAPNSPHKLPLIEAQMQSMFNSPLKLLLIEAQMQRMFNPAEDEKMMRDLQEAFPGRLEFLEPLSNPTFEELARTVRETRCDILHFSGTGNFSSEDYGLKGERPRAIQIEPGKLTAIDQFREMLRDSSISLLVLSTDSSAPFAREVAQDVPLVVALQGQVATQTMDKFEPTFYRHLLSGKTFESAITRGRQVVDTENIGIRDWALIIAYSRLDDSRLVTIPEVAPRRSAVESFASNPAPPNTGQTAIRLWQRLTREIEIKETTLQALKERVSQHFDRTVVAEAQEQLRSTQEMIERLNRELAKLK